MDPVVSYCNAICWCAADFNVSNTTKTVNDIWLRAAEDKLYLSIATDSAVLIRNQRQVLNMSDKKGTKNRPGQVKYDARETMSHLAEASLQNPERFHDVVIIGAKKRFYCLKSVLCAHSTAFQSMAAAGGALHGSNPGMPEVLMEDVNSQALEQMLLFMHTWRCAISCDFVVHLGWLAYRFNIPVLEDLCKKFEAGNMTVTTTNCCVFMGQAVFCGRTDLMAKCRDCIVRNMDKLAECEMFLNMHLDEESSVAIVNHANGLFGRGISDDQFFWVVKGLLNWMDRNRKDMAVRDFDPKTVLDCCNLGNLSAAQLQQICASPVVKKSPEISQLVVMALAQGPRIKKPTENLIDRLSSWH
ncbi:hypothetical protein BSKO_07118 [Bryopsis sp. KO-2023]|nr:hypothetical protein BSKO_07118 [Bryopsis sp. KO-2023]